MRGPQGAVGEEDGYFSKKKAAGGRARLRLGRAGGWHHGTRPGRGPQRSLDPMARGLGKAAGEEDGYFSKKKAAGGRARGFVSGAPAGGTTGRAADAVRSGLLIRWHGDGARRLGKKTGIFQRRRRGCTGAVTHRRGHAVGAGGLCGARHWRCPVAGFSIRWRGTAECGLGRRRVFFKEEGGGARARAASSRARACGARHRPARRCVARSRGAATPECGRGRRRVFFKEEGGRLCGGAALALPGGGFLDPVARDP